MMMDDFPAPATPHSQSTGQSTSNAFRYSGRSLWDLTPVAQSRAVSVISVRVPNRHPREPSRSARLASSAYSISFKASSSATQHKRKCYHYRDSEKNKKFLTPPLNKSGRMLDFNQGLLRVRSDKFSFQRQEGMETLVYFLRQIGASCLDGRKLWQDRDIVNACDERRFLIHVLSGRFLKYTSTILAPLMISLNMSRTIESPGAYLPFRGAYSFASLEPSSIALRRVSILLS